MIFSFTMTILTNNFLLDLLAVFIAIFVVAYTYFKWAFKYWEKRNVVVPFEAIVPFGNIGNPVWRTKSLGQITSDIYFALKKRSLKFGGKYSLISPRLVIADPEIIRCILSKDFQFFTDRGLFHDEKVNPLTGNMFVIGGAKWKNLRTRLSPTFTSGKMKLMFQTLVECGGPLVCSVEEQARNQTAIDIKEVLGRYTTDIIGSCAFGLECNSFESEDAEFRKQGKKLFSINFLKAIKIAIVFSVPKLASFFRISQQTKEEIDFYLNIVRDTIEFREKNNYRRNDFFQLLMDIKKNSELDPNEKPFTIEEFAAQVFVFFVAGFETSSTTMTFALYELARHPEIQQKVRDEVNSVLKQHNGKITYDAMQEMKLLRCVIDEALRMYPPVPILFRRCTKNYQISNVVIEKNVITEIPVMGIQKDPEYFPEPNEFKPERFSEKNKDKITPYTYLPFGDGPRNCIGALKAFVGIQNLSRKFFFRVAFWFDAKQSGNGGFIAEF